MTAQLRKLRLCGINASSETAGQHVCGGAELEELGPADVPPVTVNLMSWGLLGLLREELGCVRAWRLLLS